MLLTLDEARALDADGIGALSDDALQLLLDATEAEIVRVGGDPETATEWHTCNGRSVVLERRADRIDLVTETVGMWGEPTVTTLDATDYELDPYGVTLHRLNTGTNPRWRWYGRVAVTYRPADEEALRKGVQADLIKLTGRYQPGLTAETVGSWTQQYAGNSAAARERADILARLREPGLVRV